MKVRKRKHEVEVGDIYNDWAVVGPDKHVPGFGFMAPCMCYCGTYRMVNVIALVTGKSKSCGCLRIRNSDKAMGRLVQIWVDMPKGSMEWLGAVGFKRWALRTGYKIRANLKKLDESKRFSEGNCYWEPARRMAGRKREINV